VVLLLHRAVFEQLLQDFPKDLAALSRAQAERSVEIHKIWKLDEIRH